MPLAVSGLSLAILVALATSDWRRRVRDWRTDVQRLLLPSARRTPVYATLAGLAAACGLAALAIPAAASPALVTAWSALTLVGIGHRQNWPIVGAAGLTLTCGCVVEICIHYVRPGPAGISLGAGLAAAWMFWLKRLWSQQLHDCRPWTTAGRLIPAAGIVALLAALTALCAAAAAIGG